MATATRIWITPEHTGVFSTSGLSWDSARKVSEVLQDDMESHHIFHNHLGYHNHLVHHMLTIWAPGASPDTIQQQYDRESKRQRPPLPQNQEIIEKLSRKAEFRKHMCSEDNYPNFLAFFQQEIDARGVAEVVNEYLFSGDQLAESMLSRMFDGLLHPIIHLGFGMEFQQPAIVAQALAQTAIHEDYMGRDFFVPAEQAAGGIGRPGGKAMLEIMDDMRADANICTATHYGDTDYYKRQLFRRPQQDVIDHYSQWRVPEDQIQEKLAEMLNTAVYWTATAQNPHKQLKLDFFNLHAVNPCLLFKAIIDQPYICNRTKARLLEIKGRVDLLIWAYTMPEPRVEDIENYPLRLGWPEIFTRSRAHQDDGHLSKLSRTLALGQELCRPYEAERESRGLRITGDMWLKIANIAVDSVGTVADDMWVYGAAFAENWDRFPDRK